MMNEGNRKRKISNFKLFKTLLIKDLKLELKQISDIFSIVLFTIISVYIFSEAYILATQKFSMSKDIFVVEIWVLLFFVLIFVMLKLFVKEKETGTLNGMLSAPISLNIVLFSKIVFCFIFLCMMEAVLFLVAVVISVPELPVLGWDSMLLYVIFGLLLPILDLSICGTIASAISMQAKNKSLILPILLFPIILPVVSPIISLNLGLLQGDPIFYRTYEIIFISAHIVLMLSILILVSDVILRE